MLRSCTKRLYLQTCKDIQSSKRCFPLVNQRFFTKLSGSSQHIHKETHNANSIFDTPFDELFKNDSLSQVFNDSKDVSYRADENISKLFSPMDETLGDNWRSSFQAESEKLSNSFFSPEELNQYEQENKPNLIQKERSMLRKVLDSVARKDSQSSDKMFGEAKYKGDVIDDMLSVIKTKVGIENNRKVTEIDGESSLQLRLALEPTLDYMNQEIQTDFELIEFIQHNILKQYATTPSSPDSAKIAMEKVISDQIDAIKHSNDALPSHPIVNEYTLPILLEEGLRALYNNYSHPSQALSDINSIFNSIKEADSYELYCFGCNIDVFNFLMEINWKHYLDPLKIESLIVDLVANGTRPNEKTIDVLREIVKSHDSLLTDDNKRLGTLDENKVKLQDYLDDEFFKGSLTDHQTNYSAIWNKPDYFNGKRLSSKLRGIEREVQSLH
ncbi:Mtf2 protein [Saccharomycopsis crataegensis]|uniref:Mtf2 protein n=1 Tax=Saccharomycopsis crataegensis TaxID=43959 RepID=A0AAV5QP02_9ASCO|nr:Mtf2 protein [Saccharomycopsis crataegensis]